MPRKPLKVSNPAAGSAQTWLPPIHAIMKANDGTFMHGLHAVHDGSGLDLANASNARGPAWTIGPNRFGRVDSRRHRSCGSHLDMASYDSVFAS